MDGIKQECNLCENIISDFKVLGDIIKNTLDVLSLKLALDNDTQNVICSMCSSKLLAASNFKSSCLYTDNSIIPYVDFDNLKPVDLKEVYIKEKGCEQGYRMLDDREMCRLCLQLINSDHKSIQDVPVEIIQTYIPEINFAITTNPVICINCHDALCVHSSFVKNCLEVEKRRNVDAVVLPCNPLIKIEEVDIKSEQIDDGTLFEIHCNLKKEGREEGDTSLCSQNDFTDTEETKNLYDIDELKQKKGARSNFSSSTFEGCSYQSTSGSQADSEVQVNKSDGTNRKTKRQYLRKSKAKALKSQVYRCDMCTFNTTRKDAFMRHQLIHKEPSLVKMHECSECDYKSIRKDHLRQHQVRHRDRSEMQMYKCDKCSHETINKHELFRHQLRHKDPSEVEMFQCDECEFVSKHRSSFRRHQLRHKDPSEVQMYKCDVCDYKTVIISDFKRHLLKHKDPSELEMYRCDKCEFITKHRRSLRLHQLRHEDPSQVHMYTCDECDYRSVEKGGFKRHRLKHKDLSEVKTYACDTCKFVTKHKANLSQHCLRHKNSSEVRVFKCDQCDYKSIQEVNLTKHLLIHGRM